MARWCAVFLACACQAATPSVFVTTAHDGAEDVSIAVITDGARVAAYVCADDVANDPYPGWFVGDVADDGHFDLALAGFSFVGSLDGGSARGEIVDPDGSVVTWAARPSQSILTGIYQDDSDDSGCVATVIVQDDDPSQPPIVRGAACNVMQVTPVTPVALVGGRLAVDIGTAAEPQRAYVSPVRAVPR